MFFQNTGDRNYFVEHGMVKSNYEVIPGSGCNLTEHEFSPMPDGNIIRFIFIGRVMELKGIDEYLLAASAVKAKYPNAVFYIAGWNEEKKYIKIVDDYQRRGIVEYIGFRNDIKDWVSKCHCIILPSHGGEGIPNVLLESCAAGRACIGSKISGTTDVITDGITGYLFDAGNADDLAAKIEKFINLSKDEKRLMGAAGRDKVEREYDRQIIIDAYLEEIEKCR